MKDLNAFKPANVFKLLDKALDRAVELRQPVIDLGEGVKALAEQVKKLAMNVAILAHNQGVHHQMILTLAHNSDVIMSKIMENALDTKMPDIDASEVKQDEKVAAAKRRAANKPN